MKTMRARRFAIRLIALLGFAFIATLLHAPARAAGDDKIQFHIPSQSLQSALNAFALQAKKDVLFSPEIAAAKRSVALEGEYDARTALQLLLAGTGLTFRTPDDRTILVDAGTAKTSSVTSVESPIRVAQSTSDNSQKAHRSPEPSLSSETGDHESKLEQIVVTGSHIRGAEPIGSHVIVIDRAQIDQSGYGTVEDLFAAAVPQNFAGVSSTYIESGVPNLNRGAEVQLRGLGPGTTLVLVDGQRQASSGTQGAFFDISTIPVAAIERIEILPDGASALYGSDAIGGVVNVILRHDYDGAETRVRVSTSTGGVADQTQLAQIVGTHWSSGSVLVGYEYSKIDPLHNGSRAYTAASGDERAFGGADFRLPYGNPGNILSPTTFQPAFGIPKGQDGTALTVAQLLPGVVNYQNRAFAYESPAQLMNSAFLNATQKVGDSVELFTDVRYGQRDMTMVLPGVFSTLAVPVSNPFYVNPFGGGGPVRVSYDLTQDLGAGIQTGATDTLAATLGGKIALPGDWRLNVSGTYGRESDNWVLQNQLNRAALAAALASSDPSVAFNAFGDGYNTNPATLASLRESAYEHGVSTDSSLTAVIDGALFPLPGGRARLAVGIDYRREDLTAVASNYDDFDTRSARRDSAGFAELALPIIGAAQGIPGVEKFELSLAGRYDDYSDVGSTFNPKLGASWVISSALKARGTWGRSFQAPPFYLSNPGINPPFALTIPVTDPKSPSGTTNALVLGGAGESLRPETAKDWTVGLDITPLPALSLSLTYFNIDYRNQIQSPAAGVDILDVESAYANTGVVVRNPSAAQLSAICSQAIYAPGCSGPVGAILDLRSQNLALEHVSGLDINLSYSMVTAVGRFGFTLNGTRTFKMDQAAAQNSPLVSVLNTVGNPISMRALGTVSWSLSNWAVNATTNYTGSYQDQGFTPSHTISAWVTENLGVSYALPQNWGLTSGTRILLQATNIFDKQPPFVNQMQGFDAASATLIGTTWSLQLIKGW
jgi:iron complex outermembrane recepter protein